MLNKVKNTIFGSKKSLTPFNNPENLQGEWRFTGYYPPQCKPMPTCHTKKMEFKLNNKGSNGHIFSTKAELEGETC